MEIQSDRRRHRLWNFRLLLILPFMATAILLAPLALLKKSTEVEIKLKVNQMSFVIGEQNHTSLINSARTTSLTLLNFQQVELGPGDLEIATTIDPTTNVPRDWQQIGPRSSTLIISKDDFASMTLKNVTLNQLDIKSGSKITFSSFENETNNLKLRVYREDGIEAAGRIAANRTLHFSYNYCEVNGLPASNGFNSKFLRFTSKRDHELTFSGRSGTMTLNLELSPRTNLVEENIYIARDLDFTYTEGKSRKSTIIDKEGRITFKELKEKEVKVEAGDFIILDDLKDFIIKSLQINNGINITLYGRVGKLATGPAEFVDDRLPSLLEWLYARQTWVLYLNALVLIGTTVLATLNRLKLVREEE